MARLPLPGSDDNVWGDVLNEYLSISLASDGTIKSSALASKADDAAVVHLSGDTMTGALGLGTAANLYLYNTADQTTNYERFSGYWDSNVFNMFMGVSGTGSLRTTRYGSTGNYLEVNSQASSTAPKFTFERSISTSGSHLLLNTTFGGSSGTQYVLSSTATIAQSGTAGYTGLLLNITENSTGSGSKNLIDARVGGSSLFSVNNAGTITASGMTLSNPPSFPAILEVITTTSGYGIQLRKNSFNAGDVARLGFRISSASNTTLNSAEIMTQRTNVPSGGDSDLVFRISKGGVVSDALRLTSTGHMTTTATFDRRVTAIADGATITPNIDTTDIATITLGGNRTIADPTGTPAGGQPLTLRLKQDATGNRTVTWGSGYRFGTDVPQPTLSTAANKTDYIEFIYNAVDATWDCMGAKRGY